MKPPDVVLWRDLVIPLLTIIASGLMASIVTFKLNARLQRRDFLRGKLEEAYAASHEFCNALGCHFLMYLRVFTGEIDINQANELTIKNADTSDATWYRRIDMLVNIYLPTAQPLFGNLLETRARMNALVGSYRQRYLKGQTSAPDLLRSLTKELEMLTQLEEKLKNVIAAEARRL